MAKRQDGPWGPKQPSRLRAWGKKLRQLIDRLLDMDGRF